MKRYWLFNGHEYENYGGMSDFICSYNSVPKAKSEADKMYCDWCEIFDSQKEMIIWSKGRGVNAPKTKWKKTNTKIKDKIK